MKIRYDAEVDALSIVFRESTVTTQELAEGIAGEYDAQGCLAGIEILGAARQLGDEFRRAEIIVEGLQLTMPSVPAA
jgi:uncharacterized protein YuzE